MTEETKNDLEYISQKNGLSKADMLIRLIREEKERLNGCKWKTVNLASLPNINKINRFFNATRSVSREILYHVATPQTIKIRNGE